MSASVTGNTEAGAQQRRRTPIPPVTPSPDDLMIVVAGGPGAWIGLLRSAGGWENGFVTRKIDLPRNWDKLVEKYKVIVPNYIGY